MQYFYKKVYFYAIIFKNKSKEETKMKVLKTKLSEKIDNVIYQLCVKFL